MIDRRGLLGFAVAFLTASGIQAHAATALPDHTQKTLTAVLTYLNGLKTVTAHFMQVGPDGSVRTGTAIVQRPGKMRFQYDKPNPQLLVAGFGLLVYHDPELNQTSNIPLASTPLGILLSKHIRFDGDVKLLRVTTPPGEIQVTLARVGKESQGHITLVFSTNPIELRQWRITDAQDRVTQVSLYDLKKAPPFPDKTFEFIPGFNSN